MRFLVNSRTGQRIAHANLSIYHPDFGQTPAEHAESKAKRAAGKLSFEPVSERRKAGRMTKAARALRS